MPGSTCPCLFQPVALAAAPLPPPPLPPLPSPPHYSQIPTNSSQGITRQIRYPCLNPETKLPGPSPIPLQPSHAVICVSMNMRMRTRRAGTAAATIIHGGKGRALPKGGMNHVRLCGEVTESPVGTVSFCMAGRKTQVRARGCPQKRSTSQLFLLRTSRNSKEPLKLTSILQSHCSRSRQRA